MTTVIDALGTVRDALAAADAAGKGPVLAWGSVPDWVSAIGALLNLVFIGLALLREIRLRRAEEERRDQERRDLEARHARRVFVTVRDSSGLRLDLEVSNDGDGPIFDVVPAAVGAQIRNPISIRRIDAGRTSNAEVGSASVLRTDATVVPIVTFTDVDGLRWSRVAAQPPERQLTP